MNSISQNPESIDRFLKASGELMEMGASCSSNINEALESFKLQFGTVLKTHFVERAVAEMMDKTFSEFERKVRTNVQDITKICTEGGQWYTFCFGAAFGRQMDPPKTMSEATSPKAREKNA